jgi:hypothetical protein
VPEWGFMLSEGKRYMQTSPWMIVFPGMVILICVIIFNLMGDSLRDILDPRGITRKENWVHRKKAKKYSRQEFTLLADWRYGRSFNDDAIVYVLPNGNEIQCDSKSEVLLLDYLINNQLTLEIGGQELYIPYDTAFKSERFYYPDVVVLTKDYRIAIIEVKPVTAMSYHLTMLWSFNSSYTLGRNNASVGIESSADISS